MSPFLYPALRSFDDNNPAPSRPHALPVNHTLGGSEDQAGTGTISSLSIRAYRYLSRWQLFRIVNDGPCQPPQKAVRYESGRMLHSIPLPGHSTEIKPARVMVGQSEGEALWPWQRPKLRPTTGSNRTYFKPSSSSPRRDWPAKWPRAERRNGPLSGWHLSCRALFWRHLTRLAGVMLSTMGPDRPVAETFQEAMVFEGFLAIMLGRLGGV